MEGTFIVSKFAQPATDDSIVTATAALEENGFAVKVVSTPQEAKEFVLGQIPEGSEVFTATSVTADEMGLTSELNDSGKYISLRKKFTALRYDEDAKKRLEGKRIGAASDFAVGSVQAVTEDGQALIVSATGSQLP